MVILREELQLEKIHDCFKIKVFVIKKKNIFYLTRIFKAIS
jgi:hypothetical protein